MRLGRLTLYDKCVGLGTQVPISDVETRVRTVLFRESGAGRHCIFHEISVGL